MVVCETAEVEYRFVAALVRHLLMGEVAPEAVGFAVLNAAKECGVPREQALRLLDIFLSQQLCMDLQNETRQGGNA